MMLFRMSRNISLGILLWLCGVCSPVTSWANLDAHIATLQDHLEHWQTERAREMLSPLLEAKPEDLSLRYVEALLPVVPADGVAIG